MAVPDFQSFMLPVLRFMADGKPHSIAELRDHIPDLMGISEEDQKDRLPSGLKTRCEDRINWSVTYLFQAKLLERHKRGIYNISDRGRDLLATDPSKITVALLSQYPEFVDFHKANHNGTEKSEPANVPSPATQTPEEVLENTYQQLRDALAAEILDVVKTSKPEFFERLVVRLLVAMGYGGSIQDAGRAVGRAGDGGVDGIIKEDKLGLDNVYIQAKKWTDNAVGVKELRALVGSLSANRATKGVLITTSTFTKDAEDEVKKFREKIVLINGLQLAQLMIEHDVGVAVHKSYLVKKLDQDFFEGE